MSIHVSRRAPALAAAALLVLALGGAPAARANLLNLSGASCPGQQLTHPFLPWADLASYFMVQGGTFQPGAAGWSTVGGAGVVPGNEPWYVNSRSDGYSLSLPAGSSATSPAASVSLQSPTLRFFARSNVVSPGSGLRVDVLFQTTAGVLSSLQIGSVTASGGWKVTPIYLLGANVLSLLGSSYDCVAFRFTPQGTANWHIDDVYVDPWSKG